ncbi:MAG TPA: hypothetical protein VI279_15090 [Rhodocyclaceae bacterium]
MKSHSPLGSGILFATSLLLAPAALGAGFNSGSTGADGDFNPTANTVLTMPANGVFNFGTVNIPAGVKVTFTKNVANTPVIILATGTVTIAGSIDVSGGTSPATTIGAFGDSGAAGKGGPGGFDGAHGGQPGGATTGGTGFGPGGGAGGIAAPACWIGAYTMKGGGGGGFGADGLASSCNTNFSGYCNPSQCGGAAGKAYGSASVLPLVGGSGGGGGSGSISTSGAFGTGGGGGGGALLIAASGAVTLTGSIVAVGGSSGKPYNCDYQTSTNSGAGGGGAGGAVRILAPSYGGAGAINVAGGNGKACSSVGAGNPPDGGNGGLGRVSVETVIGGTLRLTGLPTLTVTKIGGIDVPLQPTGAGDVELAVDLPNPVTVEISAQSIPVGTAVKLTLSAPFSVPTVVTSSGLAGTFSNSTATASITIPQGASVLIASTTYTLTLAQGEALSVYAMGEQVDKVELAAAVGGATTATLITVSGKQYEVPTAVLAVALG